MVPYPKWSDFAALKMNMVWPSVGSKKRERSYLLISDIDMNVAQLYGMIHAGASATLIVPAPLAEVADSNNLLYPQLPHQRRLAP